MVYFCCHLNILLLYVEVKRMPAWGLKVVLVMHTSGRVYILKWLKNLEVKLKSVELQKKWSKKKKKKKLAWCSKHIKMNNLKFYFFDLVCPWIFRHCLPSQSQYEAKSKLSGNRLCNQKYQICFLMKYPHRSALPLGCEHCQFTR